MFTVNLELNEPSLLEAYAEIIGLRVEVQENSTQVVVHDVDAAAAVHKDFRDQLKYARIWGSGKHDGVMAKRDHILQDGDIIELHM